MDTAWIQVFVLTISECVAPAGKTVCKDQVSEIDFLSRADCESAMVEIVDAKSANERVILNVDQTMCTSTARKREAWASLEAISEALAGSQDFEPPDMDEAESDFARADYEKRISEVPDCTADALVYPCRQGPIIVEGPPSREVEVWRLESSDDL
jgi:hypothetical protein